MHLTDDQIYFALWCAAIAIVGGLACLIEHGIYWLRDSLRIERDGDPIEIHASRPNPL